MRIEKIQEAIEKLKQEKRNFEQTFDLIINLKKIDIKKQPINLFISLPHKIKDKKVCAFLNRKLDIIDTVTKEQIAKFKEKKDIKKLVKSYDFFIAHASLMPQIATVFGKFLGPAGKMPSPQLGLVTQETEEAIKQQLEKINKTVRIKAKEPSIKLAVGKQNMAAEAIAENILSAYNAIVNVLPRKKDNIKNVMLKLTMSKPIKIEIE